MRLPPAVIVHGHRDAAVVLAHRRSVTLLSAPGAGGYAGCLWWHALLRRSMAARAAAEVLGHARSETPNEASVEVIDLLDCADAPGHALAALRVGLRGLVLAPEAPGRDRVAEIAMATGALLLERPPPALDMAARGAPRRLHDWLRSPTDPDDNRGDVG